MCSQKQIAEQIAKQLLTIEAVKLNVKHPFTWASGLRAPIYCDNRKVLAYPTVRTFMKKCLVEAIQENFSEVEGIAGVAVAGIPQGALVAEALQLPFLYVRSKPKGHGLENSIEGALKRRQKIVVLEDLISTGGSSLQVCKTLQEADAKVLGVMAIFSYGLLIATKNFQAAGIPLFCLSNYSVLIQQAEAQGYFDQATLQSLRKWQKDPASWEHTVE
ncbi:MAG: orotate phosphoribosyltransferase [Cytophagales bacterium]|nr:orotate phosphoribosyltransferase [Cytophagales bacterium]